MDSDPYDMGIAVPKFLPFVGEMRYDKIICIPRGSSNEDNISRLDGSHWRSVLINASFSQRLTTLLAPKICSVLRSN